MKAPPAFIYCIGHEHGDPVKLGITHNPVARLQNIRAHNYRPVQLFWAVPGVRDDEHALQARFASQRIQGEWFTDPAAEICSLYETQIIADRTHPALAETTTLIASRGGWHGISDQMAFYGFEIFRTMPKLPDDVRERLEALPLRPVLHGNAVFHQRRRQRRTPAQAESAA